MTPAPRLPARGRPAARGRGRIAILAPARPRVRPGPDLATLALLDLALLRRLGRGLCIRGSSRLRGPARGEHPGPDEADGVPSSEDEGPGRGVDEVSCTPEDTRLTAEKIPGARFTVMTEIGHFPMAENPAQFRRYILPVLDEIRAAAR